MDILTCKILFHKYPHLRLSCAPFENIYFGKKKYDLVISNPPYGSKIVHDISNPDLSELDIHHFFVAKSARLLKDNGIIAMVLPQFFMDNTRGHARDIIAEVGVNLICAYRLPDNIFENAQITTDIVFLSKSNTHIKWKDTKYFQINDYKKPMNEYFINNPSHVLGHLKIVPMYKRLGITCKASGDIRTKLRMICRRGIR